MSRAATGRASSKFVPLGIALLIGVLAGRQLFSTTCAAPSQPRAVQGVEQPLQGGFRQQQPLPGLQQQLPPPPPVYVQPQAPPQQQYQQPAPQQPPVRQAAPVVAPAPISQQQPPVAAKAVTKDLAWAQRNCNNTYNTAGVVKNRKLYHSQCKQDVTIESLMPAQGRGIYVEFGADDGAIHSNTYLLEKQYGWKGVCIEPNPDWFVKLEAGDRNCVKVNAGVGKEEGELEFWHVVKDHQLSGFRQFMSDAHLRHAMRLGGPVNKFKVPVKPLETILAEAGFLCDEIDYASVDCEGCEVLALDGVDLRRFKWVTVEQNSYEKVNNRKVDKYFEAAGFSKNSKNCPFDAFFTRM